METYIGVKIIKSRPMTRLEYCGYRGWELPENEQHLAQEAGMLVEYDDTSHPNVDGHEGYVSWSPLDVFDKAYKNTKGMNFGLAIEAMKKGLKVARIGWNGKGMFVIYVPGSKHVQPSIDSPYELAMRGTTNENQPIEILPHFDMYTVNVDGRRAFLPGWLASQSDMDAADWCVVK